jgi:phosphoribosylformylglycinamidine cyclo-ligase
MTEEKAYKSAGVNIAAGQLAAEMMSAAVRSTYGPEVLKGMGAFGGLYSAAVLKEMSQPVLVASTDGVGTKTQVAARLNRWHTIGYDLVNHCVNDILVQGARPLFFLDYVAAAQLDPEQIATIVNGVAAACRNTGCALLGGETAEMPGVYSPGAIDLAGTVVGIVEQDALLDGSRIRPGDVVLGLASTGLHTNGYTLARQVLGHFDWDTTLEELGCTPGEALLAVHRCYLDTVQRWWNAGVDIRGLAHITGGGLVENLPRILPKGTGAVIHRGSWNEPPIFGLIQRVGSISNDEMFQVFNMGIGMVAVIPSEHVSLAQSTLPEDAFFLGEVIDEKVGVVIHTSTKGNKPV